MKREDIISAICAVSVASLGYNMQISDAELVVMTNERNVNVSPLNTAPITKRAYKPNTRAVATSVQREELDPAPESNYFSASSLYDTQINQPSKRDNRTNFNIHPKILSLNWGRK